MSLNSASIIILVIFFAVFFLSLALIVWMLVFCNAAGRRTAEAYYQQSLHQYVPRHDRIPDPVHDRTAFYIRRRDKSLYHAVHFIDNICGGAILLQKKVWRIILKNKIRELRKQRGISQEELAKRCGVSRQTINAIENNKYDPTLALAFKLSKELFTTVDELFQTE